MIFNSLGNEIFGKKITLLNNPNPFKRGTLQYYLIQFIVKNIELLNSERRTNESWNKFLLKFIGQQKEAFYIDYWNGIHLFEQAISLCLIHNIIKVSKIHQSPSFGIFAEDGLFDVLSEPNFTDNLPKGEMSENNKMLWLSLYMNQHIRKKNHVPSIEFHSKNIGYNDTNFSINLTRLPYNNIFDSTFNIPLSAFSDSWYSNDWLCLNSRGLFHHIGDHVGVFYGASTYGNCYFVGKNQYNQLVTLSTPHTQPYHERDTRNNPTYGLFSNVHCSDFDYVYGVPKGNPTLFDNPLMISSEESDCKINDKTNVVLAENFWNNPVFMKHTNRKMFVGSLEDKFIDILNNVRELFPKEFHSTLDLVVNNKNINKNELINISEFISQNEDLQNKILEKSSFFVKSLAHKTVCEIINPLDNLELAFFMKNNGSPPPKKTFNIFYHLSSIANAHSKQTKIVKKPLNLLNKNFISTFLVKSSEFINIWSDDEKKGFLFSELVSMQNEYRMFIINNRVVATSACFRNTVPLNAWQNGRFDPRLVNGHNGQTTHINRERVAKYAKFARKFCKEMKEYNPNCKNYVLDVAWCEEKQSVVPIEINSVTWSGAYQINMHRVCAAVVNKPFHYESLEVFIADKCKQWEFMIDDKVINPSYFDLCGLNRTLKGNTLHQLEYHINNFSTHIDEMIKYYQEEQKIIQLTQNENNLYNESISESKREINEDSLPSIDFLDDDFDDDNTFIDDENKET